MRKKERQFLLLLLVFQVILFIGIIFLAINITGKMSKKSETLINEQALKDSEIQMRERVENIINYIEHERGIVLEGAESLGKTVYLNLMNQEEENLAAYLESWMPRIAQMQYGEMIQLILYDKLKDSYTFYFAEETEQTLPEASNSEIEDYLSTVPYNNPIEYKNKTLYIVVPQENIEKRVKEYIYEVIHISIFGEDGYVWVNEVINYEGGDNYAIRRIHPNLVDTEGQYLSTAMEDAVGNLPYLKELEEIRERGEIFHTYYFKNKSNDIVCEKASYAKLYKPYNWIIATGNPLDDVLEYSAELNEENEKALAETLFEIVISLFIILTIDILVVLFINKKIKEIIRLEEKISYNEKKIEEADYESMTGLLRRGVGEYRIAQYLKNNREKKGSMILIDLDDLKGINDRLGHIAGDEAIMGIADTIKASFRQADILMRYGGDEFVVFMPDNTPIDIVAGKAEQLVKNIGNIGIGETKETKIHCSIGYAVSVEDDTFDSLFSRADKALYYVKRNGKNNCAMYKEEMENL